MSPWLDPGRDDPATEDAWNSARDTSCCYLRGVKDSLKVVHDLVFERVMEEEEENELAFSYLPPRNMLRRELWDGERASRCPPMLVQYGRAEVLAAESRNFVRIASESGIEVTSQEFKDLRTCSRCSMHWKLRGRRFNPREHSCQTFARVANVIMVHDIFWTKNVTSTSTCLCLL